MSTLNQKENIVFLITNIERFAISKSDSNKLVKLIINTQYSEPIKCLFSNYITLTGAINQRYSIPENYKLGIGTFFRDRFGGYRKFRLIWSPGEL